MKHIFKSIILLIVLSVITACGGSDTEEASGDKLDAQDKFLRIGTGPMGSGWYPITAVMSDIYMDNFNDLNVSEVEGGSTANLKALEVDDVQLALNYTSDFVDSLDGGGEFDESFDKPAGMASLYPVYQTIATLESNNDINEIEDIVDKHIFLGPKEGGGPIAFWRMMEEYDIDEETIEKSGGKISYGNYSDGASMMKDGVVDVFLAGGAPMVPALEEIDVTNPVKVLPIDDDKLEAIKEKDNGIAAGELPEDTYEQQTDPVPTYTMVTMATVSADLDEDYVYHLTEIFWDSLDIFADQVPSREKDFSIDTALEGISREDLHPGALKYYEELEEEGEELKENN